jgi:hypothetical protein
MKAIEIPELPEEAELVELNCKFELAGTLETFPSRPKINWDKVWTEFNKRKLNMEADCARCGQKVSEISPEDEQDLLQGIVEEHFSG